MNSLNNSFSQRVIVEDSMVTVNSSGSPTLFMMHAASGLAFPYLKLKGLNTGLYAIGNPYYGLTDKFNSISEMAATYITFIRTVQPNGPYYLGGWSLGGVTALEMANQLSASNETVAQVIMIDSYNPIGKPRAVSSRYRDAEQIIEQLKLSEQSPEANALRQQYCIAHELLSLHTPQSFQGNTVLLKALHPEPPEDNSPEQAAWLEQRQKDPYNGWRQLLPNLQVVGIHASHSRMFDSDRVEEVITQIGKRIIRL